MQDTAEEVVDFDIIPTVGTKEAAIRLADVVKRNAAYPFRVHVKIDSGMSRAGIQVRYESKAS